MKTLEERLIFHSNSIKPACLPPSLAERPDDRQTVSQKTSQKQRECRSQHVPKTKLSNQHQNVSTATAKCLEKHDAN